VYEIPRIYIKKKALISESLVGYGGA